jgi:hypothetical protein
MLSPIESYIRFLEETNDKQSAYFSFTVDKTGEQGVIKANKEGLRLYAAELLRKSLEMEKTQDGEPLYFDHPDWLISDAGYDLITGIVPRYTERNEILREKNSEPVPFSGNNSKSSLLTLIGGLFSISVITGLQIRTFLPFKWFS